MTAVSIIGPKFYARDDQGLPVAGGKVWTYNAGGTTIPKATWQDEGKVATNTNPVILNASGYAEIHLDGAYRIVLTDAADAVLWTSDPVSSVASDAELDARADAIEADVTALETLTSTRLTYNLGAGEDPQGLDLTGHYCIGTILGRFFFDADDTATDHDGITCIVDSAGNRFKRANIEVNAVLGYLTAPPPGVQPGEAYIVKSPAGGEWAGQDDNIAIYTDRGLLFAVRRISSRYDTSLGGYRTWTENNEWVRGIGWLPDVPAHLGIVVREEISDPPVSPTDGQRWLVGATPTGAWTDAEQSIATWIAVDSQWHFLAPYEGAVIWDQDISASTPEAGERRYLAGEWTTVAAAPTEPTVGALQLEGTVQNLRQDTHAASGASAVATVTIPTGNWLILSGRYYGENFDGSTTSNVAVGSATGGRVSFSSTGTIYFAGQSGGSVYGKPQGGDTISCTVARTGGSGAEATAVVDVTIIKLA